MRDRHLSPVPPLALELSEPLLDALAERVAARLAERAPVEAASPWLSVVEAAEYLRCKPKRIYDLHSQRRLRAHRDGGRLLFHRDDLDTYLRQEAA